MATPGVFTPSRLQDVMLKAEQMWQPNQLTNSMKIKSAAAQAVLKNQTARFDVLNERNKDNKVKVTFINNCSGEVQNYDPTCTINADELSTDAINIVPNIVKESKFSIDTNKLRDNTYSEEELMIKGLEKSIKELDEFWAAQILGQISSYAGPNIYADDGFTYDSAANMTKGLNGSLNQLAILEKQAELNRFENPYFIDNGNFYLALRNAMYNSGNAEGKGDVARAAAIEGMGITEDLINFSRAGLTPDLKLFMISEGAAAFKTVNRHESVPRPEVGDKILSTVNSITLPGVEYDMTYQRVCKVVDSEVTYVNSWKLVTRGLIALNPTGCPVVKDGLTYVPTGVLAYGV